MAGWRRWSRCTEGIPSSRGSRAAARLSSQWARRGKESSVRAAVGVSCYLDGGRRSAEAFRLAVKGGIIVAFFQGRTLSRRRLFLLGTLGMVGLDLPDISRGADSTPGRTGRTTDRSCIFIVQAGGPSQLDTWDLKPDPPAERRGPEPGTHTAVESLCLTESLALHFHNLSGGKPC
jgi:hypothetical protein